MPANSFQSFASTPFYKPRAMFPRHFHLIRKFLFRLNENALQGCVLEQRRNLPLKRTRPARKLLGRDLCSVNGHARISGGSVTEGA